jgi:hypothetical protein
MDEALNLQTKYGGGIIKTAPGLVRACEWCKANPVCHQCSDMKQTGLFVPQE